MLSYDLVISYLFKGLENFKWSEKGCKIKFVAYQSSKEDSLTTPSAIKEDLLVNLSARGYELLKDKLELCLYHVKTLDELVEWVQEEMNFLQYELEWGGLIIPERLEERIDERFMLLVEDLK